MPLWVGVNKTTRVRVTTRDGKELIVWAVPKKKGTGATIFFEGSRDNFEISYFKVPGNSDAPAEVDKGETDGR